MFADGKDNKGRIIIEDNVLIGSSVHIYTSNHKFDNNDLDLIDQGHYPSEDVCLKKGCWIGANLVTLLGVTIGENSVIGAGSIVTKSLPSRVLAVGNPAKVIRKLS